MAPEILANKEYEFPADVFSFAVTAYETWVCEVPYKQFNQRKRVRTHAHAHAYTCVSRTQFGT